MARASHKIDLVNDTKQGYEDLMKLIKSFSEEEQEAIFLFEDRDKNIRDVLIHLHEWHNMMIRWYKEGTIEKGNPSIPREGYTWGTIAEMNMEIWKQYQSTSLEKAKKLLEETHNKVLSLIEGHTNEELFLRNQYKWTGDSVLGSYFASSTASHYEWAEKKIKRQQRLLKKSK